jgi:endonuclease YncB( thermonuclease family)
MGNCFSGSTDPFHESDLRNNSFSNLEDFCFSGETKCKVIDIYDGDTITIIFYHHGFPIKTKFRLHGFDSPEIKPHHNTPMCNLHKEAGLICKEKLKDKILGKILWVVFSTKKEKFGRTMGELYEISNPKVRVNTDVCINIWMIKNGFGKKYTGGTKEEFTPDELLKIVSKK